MHQRIPRWKFICWCSQFWKHCIWICTKGTLQFILSSIVFGICCQRGRDLLSYLSEICVKVKFLCNSFTEGDYWKRENFWYLERKIEGRCVFKFHYIMTCCVAINAKEGDCWIQLIIVYCLWCYTNVISDISHLPSPVIQQMQKRVSTELTRSSKKIGRQC